MTERYSPDIIALADLPLFWQGRANALGLLNDRRVEPDAGTIGLIETYEECAKELRAALRLRNAAQPAPVQELADLRCLVATYANEATEAKAEIERLRNAAQPSPDSDQSLVILVDRFAKRLLAKLRLAHANGRRGWEKDDWESECQLGLLRHLEKGDPRDVAAYCAFMDHHGWITVPATPSDNAQPMPEPFQPRVPGYSIPSTDLGGGK